MTENEVMSLCDYIENSYVTDEGKQIRLRAFLNTSTTLIMVMRPKQINVLLYIPVFYSYFEAKEFFTSRVNVDKEKYGHNTP